MFINKLFEVTNQNANRSVGTAEICTLEQKPFVRESLCPSKTRWTFLSDGSAKHILRFVKGNPRLLKQIVFKMLVIYTRFKIRKKKTRSRPGCLFLLY